MQGLEHFAQVKLALLIGQLAEKQNLEPQIAQFGFQLAPITLGRLLRGRLDLVGLFDTESRQRA